MADGITRRMARSGDSTPNSTLPHEPRAKSERQTEQQQQRTGDQADFQGDQSHHRTESGIGRYDALAYPVYLGEHPKQHGVKSDHHGKRRVEQRVDVERHTADMTRRRQQPNHHAKAEHEQRRTGQQEQPARAEQQQEPQVPPAIAPAAQMRRPRRGRRATASSAPRRCAAGECVAFTTISLANSMPGA